MDIDFAKSPTKRPQATRKEKKDLPVVDWELTPSEVAFLPDDELDVLLARLRAGDEVTFLQLMGVDAS